MPSSPTHSPTGSRCSVTVRSALMNVSRVRSMPDPTPLPKSATAATRCNGNVSWPAITGTRSRNHTAAGPGTKSSPTTGLISTAFQNPSSPLSMRGKRNCDASPGGGSGATSGDDHAVTSCCRRACAAATRSRARPRRRRRSNVASTIWTFLPGRTTRRSMRSGDSGTGRMRSTVRRTVNAGGPASIRSRMPASSADGAPPCCAFGDHGPREISLGMATSPSTS